MAHASAFEAQLGRIAAERLGGDGAQALLELRARLLHGHAGDIGGGRRIRTGIVRGRIGVGAEHAHGIHGAFHMLGDHLGQDGVAARAHVGRGDEQHISPVVVELDGDRAHVDAGDARTLHGHGNAGCAHLAVAHVANGELLLPAEHVAAVLHATVQGAGVGDLVEVGGHGHAFAHHVLLTQLHRVAAQRSRGTRPTAACSCTPRWRRT